MNNAYHLYKPLRNKVRLLNLELCIEDVWLFFGHLFGDRHLPPVFLKGKRVEIRECVFPWELAIITREIILHANAHEAGRLWPWDGLAAVINALRKTDEDFYTLTSLPENIFYEMQRIAHQQFVWQRRTSIRSLMRYLKIFGEKDVEDVLTEKTGLTMRELYFMAFAVGGHLVKHPGISSTQDYTAFGISLEKSATFFEKMSIDLVTLRERVRHEQRFDHTWKYTWNPLEATPLIRLDLNFPERLHCPIPELLMRRITHGVFYDLVKEVSFDNAYGRAYEAYVGAVIYEKFQSPHHKVLPEKPYFVGKQQRHGSDWTLSDGTGTLFIECKTKRLPQAAKEQREEDALDKQIQILADAVVQTYRNIDDALNGHTQWAADGAPVYPMIVTLEDWYLFGPKVFSDLESKIQDGLAAAGLDCSLTTRQPYDICSVSEFEDVAPIVSKVGVGHFLAGRAKAEYKGWLLSLYARHEFADEWRTADRELFQKEWEELIPDGPYEQ